MSSPWEIYLAWAVRSWEAEVENAGRLATRVNLVLTIALAFVGAGAKLVMDAVVQHPGDGLLIGLLTGASIGVGMMFWSFMVVLGVRYTRGSTTFASYMLLAPDDVPAPSAAPGLVNDEAVYRHYLATAAAAYELHAMNTEERNRIDRGQQWLIVGVVWTVLCTVGYNMVRDVPAPEPVKVEVVNGP